jgi:hypothetical protein
MRNVGKYREAFCAVSFALPTPRSREKRIFVGRSQIKAIFAHVLAEVSRAFANKVKSPSSSPLAKHCLRDPFLR